MSKIYFATVIGAFVTTSLATNLLVVGTRGTVTPELLVRLRCRSRRVSRRLKHVIDVWVAGMLAHREREASFYVLHQMSDRELQDIGLYRGILGHVTHSDEGRAVASISPDKDGRLQ